MDGKMSLLQLLKPLTSNTKKKKSLFTKKKGKKKEEKSLSVYNLFNSIVQIKERILNSTGMKKQ
jgi:hypothetical protein